MSGDRSGLVGSVIVISTVFGGVSSEEAFIWLIEKLPHMLIPIIKITRIQIILETDFYEMTYGINTVCSFCNSTFFNQLFCICLCLILNHFGNPINININ